MQGIALCFFYALIEREEHLKILNQQQIIE